MMKNDMAFPHEPVQSLWWGELSKVEWLCINSFLANGHPFHLYTYREIMGVPDGTTVLDAAEILPESLVFRLRKGNTRGSLTGFADWFRWQLLFMRGGWWVDMDLICLRPFEFNREIVFGMENDFAPSIGAMRFPAGHSLPCEMAKQSKSPLSFAPWDSPRKRWRKLSRRLRFGSRPDAITFGEGGGIRTFKFAVDHFQLHNYAEHFYCFYPVPLHEWIEVFNGKLAGGIARLDNSCALHLWNEFMRQNKFDKNGEFPPDSVFEILRRQFEAA